MLLLFDVDPLSLQLQLLMVLSPLAGMGTDKPNIGSIRGGLLILVREYPESAESRKKK